MAVFVHSLPNRDAEALQDKLVTIYREAFSLPPYCKEEAEVVDFARSFPMHVQQEGFRIVVGREDQTGHVVGFAYGYASAPDQSWFEKAAQVAQPCMVTGWLLGSFRLVEMALLPEAHGRGIGGLLHDHVLRGLPYQRAVLATMAAETSAYGMYTKRGWQLLLDGLRFPGVPRPYRIMGLDLMARRADEPSPAPGAS